MQSPAIPGSSPADDLLMVCIDESPLSPQLVREAKRIADRWHARWLVVHVETPRDHRLFEAERNRITETLHLGEELGAEAVTIPGKSVADDLVAYARQRNVTGILVGTTRHSRLAELWRGSLVHDIIRKSSNINVYVMTGDEANAARPRFVLPWLRPGFRINGYVGSALAVACAGVIASLIQSSLSIPDLAMVFLAGVLFSAVTWGLGPSIFAAVLSVFVYDYFLVPPFYTLTIAEPQDVLALIMFLIVAVLTSNLASRVREHADALQRRESRTATLYALSQQLARSAGIEAVVEAVAAQVAQILGAKAIVLLPGSSGLEIKAAQPPGETLDPDEWATSMWVWQHNQPAGPGSETLPGAQRIYLPLTTAQSTLGVLGVRLAAPGNPLSPDQRRLLQAFADQAAVAIERARLSEAMAETRSLAETERLRSALLSSLSHDLRTPLSSIIGAVTSLLSFGETYNEAQRHDLLQTISEEAERLNRFVGNLLEMTRLESGALQLKREWVEIGDIIGSALARLDQPLSEHRVTVQIEPGLPLLRLDFVLIEQVLVNLLDNAARYSPPGTAIELKAHRDGGNVIVDVADEGVGVPPSELERIFDKFYRVRQGDRQSVGTGLGLSICRGIVDAHGGHIIARLRPSGKGTVFTMSFAIETLPAMAREREKTHE
jgi:two-component system sensor histidine kinase KdpD